MKIVNKILVGSASTKLKQLDDGFIDCCVTSPLYWSKLAHIKTKPQKWIPVRGHGSWVGELGLEPTQDMYVQHLLQIFDEVKRVLKKEGSCWVVLGDTYYNKSFRLVPEQFAIGMIEHGWILRSKIIWHKSNKPIRSRIKNRFDLNWEFLFHFTKSFRYYFMRHGSTILESGKSSRQSVWDVPLTPKSKHFLFESFPPDLIKEPILVTCPKGGLVLDPFIGSGTTALVAVQLERKFLGIELSPAFAQIALSRIRPYMEE